MKWPPSVHFRYVNIIEILHFLPWRRHAPAYCESPAATKLSQKWFKWVRCKWCISNMITCNLKYLFSPLLKRIVRVSNAIMFEERKKMSPGGDAILSNWIKKMLGTHFGGVCVNIRPSFSGDGAGDQIVCLPTDTSTDIRHRSPLIMKTLSRKWRYTSSGAPARSTILVRA